VVAKKGQNGRKRLAVESEIDAGEWLKKKKGTTHHNGKKTRK